VRAVKGVLLVILIRTAMLRIDGRAGETGGARKPTPHASHEAELKAFLQYPPQQALFVVVVRRQVTRQPVNFAVQGGGTIANR
jgi:hypothetical protein